MGAAWLTRHLWDHYLFSMDREFLRRRAWPAMKEAALFVVDFLVEAPAGTALAGRLVTCPSHSPENRYLRADGSEGLFTYAATMDLMIVRELFENCLAAIAALGADAGETEFAVQIRDRLARLAPLQISSKTGRLQEWAEDYVDAEPGHRHISHAYALYPGQAISPRTSPALAAALRRAMELRLENGGGGTGWSRAWLINLFARLGDGDGAERHLHALLENCVLPNLFDSHPPFQIDGNFGASAGVAEMLLQSGVDATGAEEVFEMDILPALPAVWSKGEIRGLRARGGFAVDIRWDCGRLVDLLVKSTAGKKLTIRYMGQTRIIKPGCGEEARVSF
jgi:alpha-L-fucosidase 2